MTIVIAVLAALLVLGVTENMLHSDSRQRDEGKNDGDANNRRGAERRRNPHLRQNDGLRGAPD